MKNILKTTAGTALIFTIALAPIIGFAKEKSHEKSVVKAETRTEIKAEKNEHKSCLKAFGHLFAFGWLKHNSRITINEDCVLPFGIAKKFGNGTTTPDTIAPSLSNINTQVNSNNTAISWDTNEKTDGAVFFGTAAGLNVNSSSTPVSLKSEMTKDHKIVLNNLSASTTYYFVIRSKDSSGNVATSSERSFKTASVSSDTNAPVLSSIFGIIGTSTIKIGWHTNENANSKVYFSTTSPITSTSTIKENSTLETNHFVTVNGLNSNTKYYFVVESKDASNNMTKSSEFSITTHATTTSAEATVNLNLGL